MKKILVIVILSFLIVGCNEEESTTKDEDVSVVKKVDSAEEKETILSTESTQKLKDEIKKEIAEELRVEIKENIENDLKTTIKDNMDGIKSVISEIVGDMQISDEVLKDQTHIHVMTKDTSSKIPEYLTTIPIYSESKN